VAYDADGFTQLNLPNKVHKFTHSDEDGGDLHRYFNPIIKNGKLIKNFVHKKTLKCKSLNGALLRISVEDFYLRIKRENSMTWKLIDEINKKKMVLHSESINK
jgi:hypothetical protein